MAGQLLLPAEPKGGYGLPPKTDGFALPSSRRIKQRAEFELALQSSRSSNRLFSVYSCKNVYGFARLGVIVSKKTMPGAVARNMTKRMIREVFRCNFSVDLALDVVVRAKQKPKLETPIETRLALIHLFQSIQK